jgi:hypothetical protein
MGNKKQPPFFRFISNHYQYFSIPIENTFEFDLAYGIFIHKRAHMKLKSINFGVKSRLHATFSVGIICSDHSSLGKIS